MFVFAAHIGMAAVAFEAFGLSPRGGSMQPRNLLMLVGLSCSAGLGLVGCASLARPIPDRRPTQVYASFSKTWGAAVDYFARSGVSVDTTDRASGMIRADATTMPRDRSHFGLCGNSMLEPYWRGDQGWEWNRTDEERPVGAPFTAIVHGDSTRATVTVTSEWIDANGKEVQCSKASNAWEQQSAAAIKAKAERR